MTWSTKVGTATIAFQSDGQGTSGLGQTPLAPQIVNVSGNVFRLAAPNTIAAVNFGNVHVGDNVSQALTITNTAANDGFSEKLNAAFGGTSDARITTSGSISLLAPGATNNSSMVVGLNTANAGQVMGTATVNLQSDGTGTSGLGVTDLASQNVPVSGNIEANGNVFRLAQPSQHTPEPVNLGNVRIGSVAQQALTVSNLAPNDGFSEKLDASIGGATAGITAAGSFSLLPPGAPGNPAATDSTSLVVGINTATAGAKAGTATITLNSNGQGTSGLGITPLPSQTVNVSGNVFRLANPTLNTGAVTLAARVGDPLPSQALSVTNTSPDAFTEGLKATFGAAPAGFTTAGSLPNLGAGLTDAATLRVGLASTAAPGTTNGQVTLNFTSTGAGTTGAPDQGVGSANVALTGKVFTPAQAQVPGSVDFGIVHKGDVVAPKGVPVTNSAPVTALNDVLRGSLGPASHPAFSVLGSLPDLGPGQSSGALQVGLNTGSAGVFNATAAWSLRSHNADLPDLPIELVPLSLTGTVNNFADPAFRKSGGAGAFSRNGDLFLLEFGTLILGGNEVQGLLEVGNAATGPADLLDGTFEGAGLPFLLAGFDPFADLGAGAFLPLTVGFTPSALGDVLVELLLHPTGHNPGGFNAPLDDLTLRLHAHVIEQPEGVPAPGSLALVVAGLLAAWAAGRRRR